MTSSLALASHGLLTTTPPVTSLNLASLGYLDELVGPGTTVTDVIGITDGLDRAVAYVRVISDSIGITDIEVIPVPDGLDEAERTVVRADPLRRIRSGDVDRMLAEIEQYLRRARPRLDPERLLDRSDLGRRLRRLDPPRWIVGIDDPRDIDPPV